MSPLIPAARDRWLALALLLAVLGLLWLLLVWPLFGQPLQQANAELTQLQTRDARLRSLLGKKPWSNNAWPHWRRVAVVPGFWLNPPPSWPPPA